MRNRGEHLQWCKDRAIAYIDHGDCQEAYASMASDMRKHPETEDHSAIVLGLQLMMMGQLKTPFEMRGFIEGFN